VRAMRERYRRRGVVAVCLVVPRSAVVDHATRVDTTKLALHELVRRVPVDAFTLEAALLRAHPSFLGGVLLLSGMPASDESTPETHAGDSTPFGWPLQPSGQNGQGRYLPEPPRYVVPDDVPSLQSGRRFGPGAFTAQAVAAVSVSWGRRRETIWETPSGPMVTP
jgi:hypothetical protein